MALLKLLLMLLPILLQICAAAPQPGIDQDLLNERSVTFNSIRKVLKKSDIIPDVLDDFHPAFSLHITYPRTHKTVKLGNTISPSDVQSSPDLRVHLASSTPFLPSLTSMTYALVLTDPDATSRSNPKSSEYCHWIVTNTTDLSPSSIRFSPPSSMAALDLDVQVDELIKYAPPAPPPKTGKHRYVFVLLAGPAGTELKKPTERPHWGYGKVRHGVRDWAKENGLVVLGANFFYAQNKEQ